MQPENRPLISVIMLSFNYARFIGEAVESVLRQTYGNFELVVVDDGSKDESLEILGSYQAQDPDRVHVHAHPGGRHYGIERSLELALSKAGGEFIAFLDADDLWHERNLEKKIACLRSFPEAGVVVSRYRPFGDPRGSFYWRLYEQVNRFSIPFNKPFNALPLFLRRNAAVSFSNVVARRSLFGNVPLASPLERNLDWWILGHLSLRSRFCFMREKLVLWRIHPGSACYGKVSKMALGRLYHFLNDYYRSLKRSLGWAQAAEREKNEALLDGAIDFLQRIRGGRRSLFLKQLILSPLETLKFTGFILLRNLFF